ncbi:transposase [Neolewinella sp.]|uniref:transposase n=1 Tax=Neolewinella sp. TaxID=2993543 RepID=UPI003B517FF6
MEAKKSTKTGKRAYRRYDANFKAEALKQLERGTSVTELAASLGVKPSLLHSWKSQAKQPAVVLEQAEEVKRLTKQLKAREQEIDILKKALRIFSQAD